MDFELKRLDPSFVDKALEKAERYRLLNWPVEAESICLDVLEVDEDNQRAIEILVLSLSDQILEDGQAQRVGQAKKWVAKLTGEYDREYYEGIVHEREGRAHLSRGYSSGFAFECFHDAIDCFERAMKLAPEGNQEALLRHNSCVRTIRREKLKPPKKDRIIMLE